MTIANTHYYGTGRQVLTEYDRIPHLSVASFKHVATFNRDNISNSKCYK